MYMYNGGVFFVSAWYIMSTANPCAGGTPVPVEPLCRWNPCAGGTPVQWNPCTMEPLYNGTPVQWNPYSCTREPHSGIPKAQTSHLNILVE
jgi:hypothetical protein